MAPRKIFWLALKAVVSIALLMLAFSATDTGGAVRVIATVPLWAWLAGVVCIAIQVPVLARRWTIILAASDLKLSYAEDCSFSYAGYFFNQALPSAIGGDFMRTYLAWKRGVPFQPALASVFLERATGLFVLALFSTLLLYNAPDGAPPGRSPVGLVLAVVALAVTGLALLITLSMLLGKFSGRGRIVRFLQVLAGQFMNLLRNRNRFAEVFLLGAISALAGLSAIGLAAHSLELPLTFIQVLGISALSIVATVLPISISGWGVRETMMIWLATSYGVGAEEALGLSVWFGLASLIAAIPGGILWLRSS